MCENCQRICAVKATGQKYCSQLCCGQANGPIARARSAELAAEARVEREARRGQLDLYTGPKTKRQVPRVVHIEGPGRWISATCRICDGSFLNRDHSVTCSEECGTSYRREADRLVKDRRRARKRSAFVANVYRKEIFERDDYMCHLCGERTDPSLKSPEHRSPSIDHVIPLANGGTHEPANCKTACWICNARKSNWPAEKELA